MQNKNRRLLNLEKEKKNNEIREGQIDRFGKLFIFSTIYFCHSNFTHVTNLISSVYSLTT